MRLTVATLCDSASVREGLLHMLGGGITAIHRESYPASMACSLAMILQHTSREASDSTKVRIQTFEMASGEEIGGAEVEIEQVGSPVTPELPVSIPIVLDMRDAGIPHPGTYEVRISLEDEHVMSLAFTAFDSMPA